MVYFFILSSISLTLIYPAVFFHLRPQFFFSHVYCISPNPSMGKLEKQLAAVPQFTIPFPFPVLSPPLLCFPY